MYRLNLLIFITLFTATIGVGSSPDFKQYDSEKELVKGEQNGVAITSKGELLLAPKVSQIFESDRPFIWDMEVDLRGNIYISTGVGARVFEINRNGEKTELAEWNDFEVYALALDQKGNVYAGSSPDGKIYRLQKNEKPALFADLGTTYIWDIIFDENNDCFVATGDSGAIYKINAKGQSSIYFQSEETHIRCLTFDKRGRLIAGTHQNGYVYRIDEQGRGLVLYDTDFDEVFQLVVAKDNTIYAACMGREGKKDAEDNSKSNKSDSNVKLQISKIISASRDRGANINSGVLRISPDGFVKNIWKNEEEKVLSIAINNEQDIIVGTGDSGRLYKIDQDEEITILQKVTESQVVSFVAMEKDRIYFATSNLGTVYRLEKEFVKSGTYISPTFDTKAHSVWGNLHWQQQPNKRGEFRFFTRSGQTEKPNATWSQWEAVDQQQNYGKINSPEARFLQWKVVMKSDGKDGSPILSHIKIAYLQQNFAPEIISFTVHPVESEREKRQKKTSQQFYPGVEISVPDELDDNLTSRIVRPTAIPRRQTDGYRRVNWQVNDKNDDELIYSLFFKHKGDKDWWLLEEKIKHNMYTWDSHKLPDGVYQLKLIASDEPTNPINAARKTEKVSDYFIVDNNGPVISDIQLKYIDNDSLQLKFVVTDTWSFIQEAHISINGTDWKLVYPIDLVCDSKREEFDIKIKAPVKPNFTVVIKASDEANNIGYGRSFIKDE